MSALPPTTPPRPSALDGRLTRRELQRRLEDAQARVIALEELAFTDALTGLRNRRYFEDRLHQEISRCRRRPGSTFSVLAIDVNGFKAVNDTHGHRAGDVLLQRLARYLLQTLRAHDVVCRTGGDEFLVVLPDAGPAEAAGAIARLVRGLTTLRAGNVSQVSVSIGAASFPKDGSDATALVNAADEAMYEDKRRQKAEAGADSPRAEEA